MVYSGFVAISMLLYLALIKLQFLSIIHLVYGLINAFNFVMNDLVRQCYFVFSVLWFWWFITNQRNKRNEIIGNSYSLLIIQAAHLHTIHLQHLFSLQMPDLFCRHVENAVGSFLFHTGKYVIIYFVFECLLK